MENLTYRVNGEIITAAAQIWLSVIIETLSPEQRAKVFELVKQREGDKFMIINPDGTTTTVLRAQKGVLKANGALAGG
jgi:hypothetical protein